MEETLPIAGGGPEGAGFSRRGVRVPARAVISPQWYVAAVVALVVLGSATLLPLWISVFRMWANDPLRSIGAIFPPLALLGVVLRWRERGWATEGSFWGLPLVLLAIPMSRLVSVSNLNVNVDGGVWGLMHLGPALFLYGVGATLLFGGPGLLRMCIAPLCLLLAINPVPHAFNQLADLPLQELSANTARWFAHAIGLQPTGEQLRMMFAPNFGMLIVPGCNGVRGSITLGYLTLIFGYTRRLRPVLLAAVSVGALLLGYVLNLLRLCLLVIYYRVGLSLPSIQKHGEGVDYAIGCTLFLLATIAIGVGVRALTAESIQDAMVRSDRTLVDSSAWARVAGFAAVALFFLVPQVHALATMPSLTPDEGKVLRLFPAQAGPFRLVRTHSEHNGGGGMVLGMGEYEAPPAAARSAPRALTLGLWVGSGDHLVALSKMVQGVRAESTSSFDASTKTGQPVHFASALYDDGVTGALDAEAMCTQDGCSAQLAGSGKHGLLFIGPRLRDLVVTPTTLRLPIILERTWATSGASPASTRAEFEEDATLFMRQVDVQTLVKQAGSRP